MFTARLLLTQLLVVLIVLTSNATGSEEAKYVWRALLPVTSSYLGIWLPGPKLCGGWRMRNFNPSTWQIICFASVEPGFF